MSFSEIDISGPSKPEKENLCFGHDSLDAIFGEEKGIPAQGITEFYGASGSGKTQIALHLTLTCLAQQHNNKVVYICTEGVFPSKRFSQLVESRTEENRSSDLGDFGERLLLRHEASIDSLVQCISNRLPKLVCSTEGVKCVIVDSIAAVFRCETRSDISHVERSEIFFQLASSLKRLSVEHGVHVIVMNQVSDIFPEDVMNVHKWLTGTKKPSLGLSWSNCVTTRILVSCTQYLMPPLEVKGNHYTGGCGQGQSEGQVAVAAVPLRRLDVVMSPFCARRSCFFVVDQSGIQAVQ